MQKLTEELNINKVLLNVIAPMGLEIKKNSVVVSENTGKIYGVIRYAQKVDVGWLSKITNIPGTIVSIGFKPIDNDVLISSISKSIIQSRCDAESAKDPLTRQRAEKAALDGEKIMLQIDQNGETVGLMSVSIMSVAQDEKSFTKVCRKVESVVNVMKCKVRVLANLQKEGLQNISPTYPTIEKLYKDEGYGMSDMALHLKNLEIFFNLYIPSLTDMQKAVLKKSLIELYNNFNIKWDTDITKLESTDFPVFLDLYNHINKKSKEDERNKVYEDLAVLLYDIAKGSDSFLWNGHSTIEAKSRCICLDTNTLQNTSDNIKRTQYFNLLSWCWEQMSKDRTEKVLLICDEAYLMIDPNVPQSLMFLRNVEKRSRKYEAALAIISHSVIDFLAESIKMYGQALLDIPCMKIIMGTDGRNLQETKELYNLTNAEEELLLSKKRGQALFMIGAKRLQVNLEIPEYKFKYMGDGGGR